MSSSSKTRKEESSVCSSRLQRFNPALTTKADVPAGCLLSVKPNHQQRQQQLLLHQQPLLLLLLGRGREAMLALLRLGREKGQQQQQPVEAQGRREEDPRLATQNESAKIGPH
ncbi:hypothetical protein Emed_004506 [Eimeria media]